jgi:hypothetical protein
LLFGCCILCVWVLLNRFAFDTYSYWDDEGYFILLLAHFLKAGGLYVKTFSQYGPFFTLAESLLHRLFNLPVDLDGGRILTVIYILSSAILLSIFVGRLTRKLALSLPCFVLSVMITAPIVAEPGHPQGVIAILVSAALCLSLLVGTRQESAGLILLGAVNAALVLTKINVGLFFCFALALPIAMTLAKSRFRLLLLGLVVIGSFCMPPVLMSAYLRGWAGSFCLYMLISFAALLVGAFQSGAPNVLRPIRLAYVVLGFVAAAVPILAWAILTGSSPASLVSGIVIRPLGHPRLVYLPLVIPAWPLLLLLLFVLTFLMDPLARRRFPNFGVWLAVGKVAIALGAAGSFLWYPDMAMFYSLPVLPLLLLPNGASSGVSYAFPRLFLVALIEFEMLQAYPMLGTHHNALTASGAWICLLLYDGCSSLGTLNREGGRRSFLFRTPAVLGWLCLALATPAVFWLGGTTKSEAPGYRLHRRQIIWRLVTGGPLPPRSPRLDLPGARLLHMPAAKASIYRRLAESVHTNCDMLFTMPGMGSLNVWSETPPPNGFNLTAWMVGFTAQEQEAIRSRLQQAARPCVVYNPDLARAWIPPGIHLDPDAPMVDYVLHKTRTVLVVGNCEIRVPYSRRAPFIH